MLRKKNFRHLDILAEYRKFVLFMRKFLIICSLFLASLQSHAGEDEVRMFSLYPVPLKSSRLFFRVNYSGTGISTVEVRNLIGKKIQEKPLPAGVSELSFDNMDANPNGVYVVVAKNGNGKVLEISKFILNK